MPCQRGRMGSERVEQVWSDPELGGRSPDATERAIVADRQQAVVVKISQSHGGRPFDDVRRALRAALLDDDLPLPGDSWLDAASAGIVAGRQFLVGGSVEEPPPGDDPPIEDRNEPRFNDDPTVKHIPPGTRMSFRVDDPAANTPRPSDMESP